MSPCSFLNLTEERTTRTFAWVQWTYHTASELHFGDFHITATQQGDSLGPLLFSFVVLQFLDHHCSNSDLSLHLWYLDDSTFIATQKLVTAIVDCLAMNGLDFGLHLNLEKCEVF